MSVIKLIISDIDGTILDQKHQLDSHLLELMPLLKQSDIPFVLASCSLSSWYSSNFERTWNHNFPIASYNGALISTGDKILSQHTINKRNYSYYMIF